MTKMLRALVEWLERKFPDKIIVTASDYENLRLQGLKNENDFKKVDEWAKRIDERLKKIEAEINKFNAAFGFGGVAGNLKAGPFQR